MSTWANRTDEQLVILRRSVEKLVEVCKDHNKSLRIVGERFDRLEKQVAVLRREQEGGPYKATRP